MGAGLRRGGRFVNVREARLVPLLGSRRPAVAGGDERPALQLVIVTAGDQGWKPTSVIRSRSVVVVFVADQLRLRAVHSRRSRR